MWDKPDGSQGMDLSATKVKAGEVTFEVTNVSKNDEEHEFLIAKTDLAPEQLPITQAGARLQESKLPDLQELGDLEPGENGTLTVDLMPGKYLLFCNEEGHFAAGMYAYLTVDSRRLVRPAVDQPRPPARAGGCQRPAGLRSRWRRCRPA